MMDQTIISIKDLTKVYDGLSVVNHLSLSVKKGEIFGLLGPNGAGKSTTILMLLGLIEPTSGEIRVCDIDPTIKPIDIKKRVGYLPDDLGFYQNMTGMENLLYTASLNGISRNIAKQKATELLEMVGLTDASHKKTGKYSRGMKQRLGLADVLIKEPEIIILDEPTLGIDPEGVREVLQFIKQLNEEQQITVLLSSHHLHQIQQVCDRVGIFVKGQLLAQGNIDDLASQLFFEDSYVIHVDASPINKHLIESIELIKGINRINQTSESTLEIYCQENVTSRIAQTIIENDVELTGIRRRDFSLDEIYLRYFEGGESNEGA